MRDYDRDQIGPHEAGWWAQRDGRRFRVREQPHANAVRSPGTESTRPTAAAAGTRPKPRKANAARSRANSASRPPWHLGPTDAEQQPVTDEDAARAALSAYEVVLAADRPSGLDITVTRQAAEQIEHFASKRGFWTEEGGVMLGLRTGPNRFLVTDVGGPGPKAKRTATSYKGDAEHDHYFVRDLERRHGGRVQELGDWHLHPVDAADPIALRPSDLDMRTWAAGLAFCRVTSFVGLIVAPARSGGLDAAAWAVSPANPEARRAWFRCQPARLAIEGGRSWS